MAKIIINKSCALSANEGSSTKVTKGSMIIAHSTANPDTKAKNNALYEKRTWTNAYVHFIVDDTGIYQVGEPGYVAWGCGPVGNYLAPVQIELCEFTNKTKALRAYKKYVDLIRWAIKKYGCEKSLNSNNRKSGVKTHSWVSQHLGGTDHSDPVNYLKSIGVTMKQFEHDIKAPSKSSAKRVVVKKGDTLYSLARKYHTTVSSIKAKNKLKSNLIKPGQVLKL